MEKWLVTLINSPEIISVFLTALIAALLRFIRPAPRLIWGTSHGFTFSMPAQNDMGQTFLLHTGTVFVQNTGRKAAESVEVIFNYRPQHFQVWPPSNYTPFDAPENRFAIKFSDIPSREFVAIELVSAGVDLPATLRVKTPSGNARPVPIAPMRVWPSWFYRLTALVLLLGCVLAVYLAIKFIAFIAGF